MDYGRMIRESFELAWRNKTLWILGLFAGFGGSFNTSFGKHDFKAWRGEGYSGSDLSDLGIDPQQFWHYLAPFLIGLAIFGLIYIVMYCIATPALIDAVNRITRGGVYKLGESFSTGVDFFWRILGMMIFLVVVGFLIVGMGVAVVFISFTLSKILGVLTIVIAIPLAIAIAIAGTIITGLAQRALVVRNISIGDALAEGYNLFRTHLGKSIAFFFISFLLGIALSMAIGIALLLVYGPIGLLAYSLGAEPWLAFLIAIVLALPVSIPLGGYLGTFFSSLTTKFYFGLVEPNGPQWANPVGAEPTPQAGI
jgi:hypothetical protein